MCGEKVIENDNRIKLLILILWVTSSLKNHRFIELFLFNSIHFHFFLSFVPSHNHGFLRVKNYSSDVRGIISF